MDDITDGSIYIDISSGVRGMYNFSGVTLLSLMATYKLPYEV